jgi:SAM-dependent methyltransferase
VQPKDHWERVYSTKAPAEVSWFQKTADLSLRLVKANAASASCAIIDVGGGASTLVDGLLANGFSNLTVLDLSAAALSAAKSRLGARAEAVHWLEADITKVSLPAHAYELWHDRAVFHFLTEIEDRAAYVSALLHAVKPGGHIIIATFAEDGPTKCSGLPVVRYSADQLRAEFGEQLSLSGQYREAHQTPFGTVQQFLYCTFRKARL